uniref:Ricin B-type lectin domain-containing protein n=1 Tax=Ascaris lumbricoides TaxID=6252 RepID=A0A0M3HU29_ASCLU
MTGRSGADAEFMAPASKPYSGMSNTSNTDLAERKFPQCISQVWFEVSKKWIRLEHCLDVSKTECVDGILLDKCLQRDAQTVQSLDKCTVVGETEGGTNPAELFGKYGPETWILFADGSASDLVQQRRCPFDDAEMGVILKGGQL